MMNEGVVNALITRICVLEKQVKNLQNQVAPTIPIYDQTNFPQDAVNGQIALGLDGNMWKYQGNKWTMLGGIGAWHYVDRSGEPPFQNGWANDTTDPNAVPMRFRVNAAGTVEIEGSIVGGTLGSVIFTLPVGYQPDYDQRLDAADDTGVFAVLEVKTTGDVIWLSGGGS